jgi:CHASE2 domain-containing sensor protein/two-component sensor histidine kinase
MNTPLAKIKQNIHFLQAGGLLGFALILLVISARALGILQPLELNFLDFLLRSRPEEPIDSRIIIIGINERDIQNIPTYPIPDREIAQLIKTLAQYQPIAIGLDNVRDKAVEPGNQELNETFKTNSNIIGIEKIVGNEVDRIKPPSSLPPTQLGFSDVIPDRDGKIRRTLLTIVNEEFLDGYKSSLSLKLAEIYLRSRGIDLENGREDLDTIRFQNTEFPRFTNNFGGYINTDAGGLQVLLNYRNNKQPFTRLSLADIKTQNFSSKLIKDKIVLIGITAASNPDYANTNAIIGEQINGHIYGVEYQAHATSQIISSVLDGRILLQSWSEPIEYTFIVTFGIVGIFFSFVYRSPWKNLLSVNLGCLLLIVTGYLLLLAGWWIPIMPTLLVFAINGVTLTAFYQYDRFLRWQIQQRKLAIEQAYNEIHNSPLQDLAIISRSLDNQTISREQLLEQINKVNLEIRDIFETLKTESIDLKQQLSLNHINSKDFRLGMGIHLNLQQPLHQIFCEIYDFTIRRDLPYFKQLKKIQLVDFKPIDKKLNLEEKREICRFLEEAICNVGKHALGATKITVIGKPIDGWYSLTIKDNGQGITSDLANQGTKQAQSLAKKLRGKFIREAIEPQGTLCELSFPLSARHNIFIQFINWFKKNKK